MPTTIATSFRSTDGELLVETLPAGNHKLHVVPTAGRTVHRPDWITAYPLNLVREIFEVKGLWVCDEIMRDEDPRYVENVLRHSVLGYLAPEAFAGSRILDFGCGSGASMMVLRRLLPPCSIVGIELEERLLHIARERARHLRCGELSFLKSPSGDSLPPDLGEFDFIMFNAVFEHLLPHERTQLLPKVWRHLRPGGVLFLNQTPYRYSPVEIHTTGGMPLINYLPDALTLQVVRRFSRNVGGDEDWDTLLRQGIRGATVPEIMGILERSGDGRPQLLEPRRPAHDRIDLWFNALSSRHATLKRGIKGSLKLLKRLTGVEITPSLSLAIRKA